MFESKAHSYEAQHSAQRAYRKLLALEPTTAELAIYGRVMVFRDFDISEEDIRKADLTDEQRESALNVFQEMQDRAKVAGSEALWCLMTIAIPRVGMRVAQLAPVDFPALADALAYTEEYEEPNAYDQGSEHGHF